jgi:hypothetical protein
MFIQLHYNPIVIDCSLTFSTAPSSPSPLGFHAYCGHLVNSSLVRDYMSYQLLYVSFYSTVEPFLFKFSREGISKK